MKSGIEHQAELIIAPIEIVTKFGWKLKKIVKTENTTYGDSDEVINKTEHIKIGWYCEVNEYLISLKAVSSSIENGVNWFELSYIKKYGSRDTIKNFDNQLELLVYLKSKFKK